MAATVVVSILQGVAAVLAFSRTAEFLSNGLKSYVREKTAEAEPIRPNPHAATSIAAADGSPARPPRHKPTRLHTAAPRPHIGVDGGGHVSGPHAG
jgi:hypothetical protein